jgi:hypothetical protein
MKIIIAVFFLFSFLFLPFSVNAQIIEFKESTGYGMWISHAPNSSTKFAKMANTSSTYFGLQFSHSTFSLFGRTAYLQSEIVLLGYVQYPNDGRNGPRDWRMGLGVNPLRIEYPLSRSKIILPFFTLSGGLIYFDSPFPNGDGTRLNYIADAGFGWNIKINESADFQFGYRLQHLSNGNSGKVNPGIDSHTLFTSIRINR